MLVLVFRSYRFPSSSGSSISAGRISRLTRFAWAGTQFYIDKNFADFSPPLSLMPQTFTSTTTWWPTDITDLIKNKLPDEKNIFDKNYNYVKMPLNNNFINSKCSNFQISLAWKGIRLERRYGSIGFTGLLIFFTAATGFMYALLAKVRK